ncbi:Cholecystokinin receptor type A, partial [Stegodyphus mimosarum]
MATSLAATPYYENAETEGTNFTQISRNPPTHAIDPNLAHLILPYSIIFILAVSGNVLVIVTLLVNKRMRTVTNVFLFNL